MVRVHSWARVPLVLVERTDGGGDPPAGVVRQCTEPARPPAVLRATIGDGSRRDLPATGTPVWAVVCAGVVGSELGPMVIGSGDPETGDLVSLYRDDGRGSAIAIVFGGEGRITETVAGGVMGATVSTSGSPPLVGFTFDNVLAVVDPATGALVRELATVPVGMTSGPVGVLLTPDRRTALAMWGTGEGCDSEHIGAVRVDGSGSLSDWGTLNGYAAVSPDGRRVAWTSVSADCRTIELVVHTVADGSQRRIVLANETGDEVSFTAGRGPWWTADSASVVLQEGDPNAPVGAAYQRKALVFDVATATSRRDARTVALPCLSSRQYESVVVQDTAGGSVVLLRYDETGASATVWRCPLDGGAGTPLLTLADRPLFVSADATGRALLFTGRDGALSASVDGAAPQPLPVGRFRFLVAW